MRASAGRTVLICHDNESLNRDALPRWLASFTDLAGIIVIEEPKSRFWKRLKKEISRIGLIRTIDVALFRLYYKLKLAAADRKWEEEKAAELLRRYSPLAPSVRVLHTHSPNSPEAENFLKEIQPDLILARCKFILNRRIFTLARVGTFVMHPGICPEYRNAHGCFWALASRDLGNVGMTLLKIDAGVDTGPVYGYFRCDFDEQRETHIVIQHRTVFDNLDAIEEKFRDLLVGKAQPIDTSGRKSAAWGQPWLTRYLSWKRHACNGKIAQTATR
jgi:hypothetical protein